ncbi:MAG TPA: hypothetical protein VLA19_23060, partial [Herpetosiphonaceae bacterium]|nr:hypothetical protein [Herpetosiphonaceae bacterium]
DANLLRNSYTNPDADGFGNSYANLDRWATRGCLFAEHFRIGSVDRAVSHRVGPGGTNGAYAPSGINGDVPVNGSAGRGGQ